MTEDETLPADIWRRRVMRESEQVKRMLQDDALRPEEDILTDSLFAQGKILTQEDLDEVYERIKNYRLEHDSLRGRVSRYMGRCYNKVSEILSGRRLR